MRVFVCGSLYDDEVTESRDREAIKEAARQIGAELGAAGVGLVVGTDIRESVDTYVIEGALEGAKRGQKDLTVDIFHLKGAATPFSLLREEPKVRISFHEVESDSWHVAHMEMVRNCDCVLLLAGRKGTLVSGLSSMLHGVPFVPIGAFGGGAYDVWRMARHDLKRYFFGTLSKDEVDELQAPWLASRASSIADYLRRLVASKKRAYRVSLLTKVVAIVGAAVGILGFLYCLAAGDAEPVANGLMYILLASLSAGAAGAGLEILTDYGNEPPESLGQAIVRVLKGVGAGFLGFLLLLLAQLLTEGGVSIEFSTDKFLRFLVLAGVLGAYGGLCTDALVHRFIRRVAARLDEGACPIAS